MWVLGLCWLLTGMCYIPELFSLEILRSTDTISVFHEKNNNNLERLLCGPIYYYINTKGFVFFFLSNILTGLVNMSVNTLNSNDTTAMSVLVACNICS